MYNVMSCMFSCFVLFQEAGVCPWDIRTVRCWKPRLLYRLRQILQRTASKSRALFNIVLKHRFFSCTQDSCSNLRSVSCIFPTPFRGCSPAWLSENRTAWLSWAVRQKVRVRALRPPASGGAFLRVPGAETDLLSPKPAACSGSSPRPRPSTEIWAQEWVCEHLYHDFCYLKSLWTKKKQ